VSERLVVATNIVSGLVWLVVITRAHTRFSTCGYPFDLGVGLKKQVVRPVVLKRWVVRPVDLKKQVVRPMRNSLQVREIVVEVISPRGSPTTTTKL
jgi:hypothetical protein